MIRTVEVACFSALAISLATSAAHGQIVIGSGQTVPATVSTADNFILNGGTLAPTNVSLSGTIELQTSSSIIRPKNPLQFDPRGGSFETTKGPTNLNGPISGAGDLTIGNLSRDSLFIKGDNTYTGHTYLTAGHIVATTATAFGTSAGGTTVKGANVRLDAAIDELYRVESGSLQFNAGDFIPSQAITIAGGRVILPNRDVYQLPIVLEGGGGSLEFPWNGTGSWTGGSSGAGSLTLVGQVNVDAPLTHDGDLILRGGRLNVPNTYTGKTVIAASYAIDRGDVFGTSTSPIEISSAEVTLQTLPNGNRGFAIPRGTLNVQTTTPINAGITLGGVFEAHLRGIGTFNAPIDYITTQGGGDAHIMGGTFNGPIRGDTDLRMGGNEGVTLNAANEIHGRVHVTGGKVVVNHIEALPLPAVLVQGGLVEMNVPATALPMLQRYPYGDQQTGTFRLNADQHFAGLSYLGEGTLEAGADISFDRVLARGTEVKGVGQGSVTVDEELLAFGASSIAGGLKGQGTVVAIGSSLLASGDLTGFEGDFAVKRGGLTFGHSGSFTAPYALNPNSDIHVYPGAVVNFGTADGVIHNDIYLHSAAGNLSYPAPLASGGTLAGLVDVGDGGSTFAGSLVITGTLRGRDLAVVAGGLGIESPQAELHGDLRIHDGAVNLYENGSLSGLDSIRLEGGGAIAIRTPGIGAANRVNDATAIHSRGGKIELYNYLQQTASETVGALQLDRGLTEVQAQSGSPLWFTELDRNEGALLRFSEHSGPRGAGFVTPPALTHGMLGAWATTDSGFATLDGSNRFVTVTPTSSNLNTAGPTDHVRAPGQQALTSNRVVASLNNPATGSPYSIDLNGHQLTVRSGGVYSSGDIIDGTVTAGAGQPAELIFYQTREVSANIVDNGPEGSVSLIAAENGLRLSGVNTYTGGTWVVGDSIPYYADRPTLTIVGLPAIPQNDRVHLDFGQYDVKLASPGTVKLAELHVRNDSRISGFNVAFDADAYYLEHGLLLAPLIGNGTIYKDSDRPIEFGSDAASPNFTGDVYVRDGVLRLQSNSIPNAKVVVEGGRLEAPAEFNSVNNNLVLDGGELLGNFRGAVQVISDSALNHGFGYTRLYGALSGEGDLTIRGERPEEFAGIFGDASQYTGELYVESGALRIGAPAELGAGQIFVGEGAQLTLGSNRPSDGPTVLERDVHIERGSLYVTPPSDFFSDNAPNGVVAGDVYVEDFAFFGANAHGRLGSEQVPGLVLAGEVILSDGAMVIGRARDNAVYFQDEVPLVEISGDLVVGTGNVWRLELADVGLTGTIRAGVSDASIDFQGSARALQIDEATIVADEDRSLSITVNGAPGAFNLTSEAASLAGNGSLQSSFALSGGASITPGSSPGSLTIAGDLTMGPGAVYKWEFDNAASGPGVGWDLINVEGAFNFTATTDAPWILQLDSPGAGLPMGASEWLIAQAMTIDGFNPAAVNIALAGGNSSQTMASQFSVEMRGTDLYLVKAVPEPASLPCLSILGLLLSASARGRKKCGHSRSVVLMDVRVNPGVS